MSLADRGQRLMSAVSAALDNPEAPPPAFLRGSGEPSVRELPRRPSQGGPQAYAPRPPLPDYAQVKDGVSEPGRLSAEVMVMEYEGAAREVEAMCRDLVARVTDVDNLIAGLLGERNEMLSQTQAAVRAGMEAAEGYRANAAAIHAQIQDAALLADKVKTTCSELRNHIAVGALPAAPAPETPEEAREAPESAGEPQG